MIRQLGTAAGQGPLAMKKSDTDPFVEKRLVVPGACRDVQLDVDSVPLVRGDEPDRSPPVIRTEGAETAMR